MRTIRNARVAVVGGAGFLGSHLVDHLLEDRGCEVLVLDNLSAGRREFVNTKAKFEHCDITKSEGRLKDLFQGYGIKFVFNYASMPYVPVSFARPLHVVDVNAVGAMQVIHAAQIAGAEAILQVSSAEIYGEHYGDETASKEYLARGGRLAEDAPVRPHSSYGASKAAVDYFVQCRWREARTPCIALRQFNCVGERETHPYVIPEIIGQLSGWHDFAVGYEQEAHEPPPPEVKAEYFAKPQVVRLGNNSFRDFLYAGDAVRIAVELLERGQFGEVYNLGSEGGVKIYDLAALIGKVMGFERVEVVPDQARVRPWEIWHLQSDNSKLWQAIMPRSHAEGVGVSRSKRGDGTAGILVGLEEALRRTVAWYEGNGRKWPWEA